MLDYDGQHKLFGHFFVCVWNLSSRTKTTKEQKTNQVDEHTHCFACFNSQMDSLAIIHS